MRKKLALIILLVVATSALMAGCSSNQTNLKKGDITTVTTKQSYVDSYMTITKTDRNVGDNKRVELYVYVNDSNPTADNLKKYADEIIKNNYPDYNAVRISFYDIREEAYRKKGAIPVGVATYAPSGDFANSYDKSVKSQTKILNVDMNQVNKKVTPEEKEVYNNYLNIMRNDKNKTTDDIAKQLGKTAQELLQLSANVSTRYTQTVRRD